MNLARYTLLAIVAAAVPAACSGGADAGTDAAPDGDAAADAAVTGACDPFTQNCPAGSKCDFGCDGTTATIACRADNGSAQIDTACSSPMSCAKGAGCMTMPGGTPTCRKYCAGDGDCATGQRCHNVDVTLNCGGPLSPLPLHVCY